MSQVTYLRTLAITLIVTISACTQVPVQNGNVDYPNSVKPIRFTTEAGDSLNSPVIKIGNAGLKEDSSNRIRQISHSSTESSESAIEIPVIENDIPQTATLLQLEQLALDNNPTVQQATAVVQKAYAIQTQVGLSPNPVVGYSGTEIGNEGHAGQQGVFLEQTFVRGGKLEWNRDIAGHDIQALSWELEAQKYRVKTDVRVMFYKTLGAQERVKLAGQLVEVAQSGVKAAKDLLKAELGTKPDVLQAEIQLNQVQIVQQSAVLEVEAAWNQLAGLIGQPSMSRPELVGSLSEKTADRNFETSLGTLTKNSPEIQAAKHRVNRAYSMICRQQIQTTPNVLAGMGVAYDTSTNDRIANIQVGFALPLFNRNEGNISLATAEYHRATQNQKRLELALRVRLTTVFRDYRQAKMMVQQYEKEIIPKADENHKLTKEGYEKQEYGFLRVFLARRSKFDAALALVQAQVKLRNAEAMIDGLLLTGGLNDVTDISQGAGGTGTRGQALSGQ